MAEPDVSTLLTVAQATAIIEAVPVSPRIIDLPLDQTRGLRLAADLSADRDYPPFDKSQMDGIACRHADLSSPLQITGEIPAGEWPTHAVTPGTCLRIMTGAPLPAGADTVVPVEFLEGPDSATRVTKSVKPGNAIARRGSEIGAGAVVLPAGSFLGPAQLAVAATVGAAVVRVHAPVRIAVLSTGDELVPIDAVPGPAQIRNSNSIMLAAMVTRRDREVITLPTCPDDPAALRRVLQDALRTFDVLFISGGMSMGTHDHVPKLLQELGVTLRITKLKIKPGKPFLFGTRAGTFVIGLPGNPVSSFVCTTLFASPLLTRLTGGKPISHTLRLPLASPLPPNGPREFYQPATTLGGKVHPLNWKGSSDVFTLATACALLIRPENDPARNAGDPVDVLLI